MNGTSQPKSELWIACIDARELPEMAGQLVYRNLGSIVSPGDLSCVAAIDTAVQDFGVRRIVICGHSGCRCLDGTVSNGTARQWLMPLAELAETADERKLLASHVERQAISASRLPSALGRDVEVIGLIYDESRRELEAVCSHSSSRGAAGTRSPV